MVVRVPELLAHVLRNPASYPGPHNTSQERTSKGYQKLDTTRQLQLIWTGIVTRLEELLHEGKSVSIQNLGCFSFVSVLHEQRYGADKVSREPAFIPSRELQYACPNYDAKEKINVYVDALSSAQSCPSKVMILNEVPVAAGTYFKVEIVRSAMKQIFSAVVDLAERGYEMDLGLGNDIKIVIHNRSVKALFSENCKHHHTAQISVGQLKSGTSPQKTSSDTVPRLSDTWKTADVSKAMSTLLDKPNSNAVHQTRVAVQNLQVMSKDLTSC